MQKIETVTIVGGTHGNEFSGIYLLKYWQQKPTLIERPSFNTSTLFANPPAYAANCRYRDADLNRQFRTADLANPSLTNYEQSRAKVINRQLGPKHAPKVDLVIDLHNTTSNMGPCLLLVQQHPFYNRMAAYVQMKMPQAVVVLDEDHKSHDEHHLLCTCGKFGIIIEVGPQPQSVLRQDVLEWMSEMTQHVLDFVEHYNNGTLPNLPSQVHAYRYIETLKLPTNAAGERIGMVHKNVQDQDFKPLNPGDPIFTLFDGSELCYQGDYVAYPHFINEAAYYDNNLAMSLAKQVIIEVE